MKDKLIALVKDYGMKLYAASPFFCGCVVGYFGRPFFKIALDVAIPALKLLFKL